MPIPTTPKRVRIPVETLLDAVERSTFGTDNPGFCLACGAEHEGVEPDARNYECEYCGENQVFGAEEILMMGGI